VLFAIRRWPAVAVRLLKRFAEQSQTLEAQLVIAQLARVEQRVFALMWLLAQRWVSRPSSGPTFRSTSRTRPSAR